MFSTAEINRLLVNPGRSGLSLLKLDSRLARRLTPSEEQALFDIGLYLKDDLLTKVDIASMRYSLEARVPILDHMVVEFALNLDPKLKVKNGVQKYLLKEVLYDLVPRKIFDRPKWGFSVPLCKWLRTDLSYLIDENLNKKVVNEYGFVKWQEVENLLRLFRNGHDHLYNRIWLLVLLHGWLKLDSIRSS
jgi:asparagine synthase (glutamine-hydrolysing)